MKHMLTVLTMTCHGDFLFWSCLLGFLSAFCIFIYEFFVTLRTFSSMILLKNFFFAIYFSLVYAKNLILFYYVPHNTILFYFKNIFCLFNISALI